MDEALRRALTELADDLERDAHAASEATCRTTMQRAALLLRRAFPRETQPGVVIGGGAAP